MKGLLFLARLALICNLLFLVCLGIRRTHDFINIQEVNSIIIVLGWLLAPFINLAAVGAWLVKLLKKSPENLPVWLAVTNLAFLVLQFFVHFIFA